MLRQRDEGANAAGAAILPLATATVGPSAIASRIATRSTMPTQRPFSTARTGPSVTAAIGTASLTLVVTGSSGPPVSSPGFGSRMIQRSVSTWVRGMSRTKFST